MTGTTSFTPTMPLVALTNAGVAAMATQYVTGMLAQPKPVVPHRVYFKRDADGMWLRGTWNANSAFCNALAQRVGDPSQMQRAVSAAIGVSDSRDAGLAMGFLHPEYDCTRGSAEFRDGFRLGAVHALKPPPPLAARLRNAGMLSMTGACALLTKSLSSPYVYEEQARFMDNVWPYMKWSGMGVMLYGATVMFAMKLFSNDASPSEHLIVSGPFRYQRNPYYASLVGGFSIMLGGAVAINLMSPFASVAAAVLAVGGIASFAAHTHVLARNDERVLTRQFGDEYREYMRTTPRYFPSIPKMIRDVWGLFRRK